jgi:hypothetical protein
VIGAPYVVSQELINVQNIQKVFHGLDEPHPSPEGLDPYEVRLFFQNKGVGGYLY